MFEYLPLGRYLYVLGASPRAAELNGISAKRYVTLGFVAAGTLAAFAGIVLQSQLQVGQSSVGQEYLLPAFTAALLGATSIRPGRVNVWGTVLAVAVLAVTVAGLNQLGAPFFVEPLFNGSMLILAVGLAVQAVAAPPAPRHRGRQGRGRRRRARRSTSRGDRSWIDSMTTRPDMPPTSARSSARDWFNSRWGADDQRGNGNLMTPAKVLEASSLIRTGEIVSLGMPYDARMPIAPGRAYALRMPGGPTGGPYGEQEPDDLERRVHRHRDRPDRHPDGRARPSRLHVRRAGATRPTCSSTTATGSPTCGRPTG